ncbi:MAG TPA: tail fiber domain-containing protein [Haliangiales bacterium]|nr:tail fiber domain-containing protein [Haliangiales bacterium]
MSVFDKLGRIRGVTWVWEEQAGPLGKVPSSADAGVIAQEVEAAFPELVVTGADGHKRVSYTGLVGILVEAVKELEARNAALERRVTELERTLERAK